VRYPGFCGLVKLLDDEQHLEIRFEIPFNFGSGVARSAKALMDVDDRALKDAVSHERRQKSTTSGEEIPK
jgi:hypothetical protein